MSRPAFLDVPKPAAVAELATTGLGLPVPFITAYRPDDGRKTEHLVDTGLGKMCACSCVYGEGRPMLGKQCVTRERLAMRRRLCGVCGQPLDPAEEIIFVGVGEGVPERDGPVIATSIEAPTHPLCTVYSALTCPRLMRSPDEVWLGLAEDFEMADSILTGWDEQNNPIYRIAPHGTDRRRIGALNSYVAFLHPDRSRLVPLSRWLREEAPRLD